MVLSQMARIQPPARKRKTGRSRAVLEKDELARVRAVAREAGPLEKALVEWIFTNCTRASEPGLARMSDIDMRGRRVQLVHLKGGLDPDWLPMMESCHNALVAWLPLRDKVIREHQQRAFVFPSARPTRCYPCNGLGRLLKRNRKTRTSAEVPCPHCDGDGTRWGLSRHESRRIIERVFARAGIDEKRRFPHVLRNTAVTVMIETMGVGAVQERVGHSDAKTTYGYMKATKAERAKAEEVFREK